MVILYFAIALLGGISIVVSRILNSKLGEHLGVLQGSFYNFLSGLILSTIMLATLFIFGKFNPSNVELTGFPIYFYFGGFIGIAVTVLSNYFVPKISAFYFTLFMFVGQLASSIVFDYFVYGNFSLGKLLGAILVVIGLVMNLNVDRKEAEK